MDERLYDLLAEHINKELRELGAYANVNDMHGIIENVKHDLDERILQYRDVVNED